ncbi:MULTISPECIES: hypothetical protein [unclassified Arthrobacter]|uniref:hypothetical protein n=1 Tax=unclassified Arthrobacter TaxID=235627 RepID=UPI0011B0AED1|nr:MULTISPECIES: hypothetical protein [unclassified Arthrobacter]
MISPCVARAAKEEVVMFSYGLFEWVFWVLAIGTGLLVLMRSEVLSSHSSQRTHRHAGQQSLLIILAVVFAVCGFVTAVMAMRATM